MIVEANKRRDVREAYENAAMVTPDGRPLAWALRLLGHDTADCVSGPVQVPLLLAEAERRGTRVGFYGGRVETLERLQAALRQSYPALQVSYVYSPPFRELSAEEDSEILSAIEASGTELLFIGLGSIKQELWMQHRFRSLSCVCLGVGAVFEFLSSEKKMPPPYIQALGLTWLVRLCQEPRRLIGRNLASPIFAIMFFLQFVTHNCWRLFGISRPQSLVRRNTP
jgi:N-acetylglucosaminyldiphosphoundecaprenol N-acetyl-beta-D-mannosaminyltransferase